MALFEIWTDASWIPSPIKGKGRVGMAAIILTPETLKIIIAKDTNSTNCRAELLAAIIGVQAIPIGSDFNLFTDSMYVIRCIRGANIKINADIALIFRKLLTSRFCNPIFIKSHSGNAMNDLADYYAKFALHHAQIIPREFRL